MVGGLTVGSGGGLDRGEQRGENLDNYNRITTTKANALDVLEF